MKDDHHGKEFLVGAMIGSTLGALSAMMFTTKKGHKVQDQLLEKYHEFECLVKKYATGKHKQAKKAVNKVVKKAAKTTKKKIRKTKKTIRKKLKKSGLAPSP